jgi:hypothetical protein
LVIFFPKNSGHSFTLATLVTEDQIKEVAKSPNLEKTVVAASVEL